MVWWPQLRPAFYTSNGKEENQAIGNLNANNSYLDDEYRDIKNNLYFHYFRLNEERNPLRDPLQTIVQLHLQYTSL